MNFFSQKEEAAPTEEPTSIVSADGTVLHAVWWRASSKRPPTTVLLLVHGIHQSSHLYRPDGCSTLVRRLINEAQCDVIGLDLRGFGRSAGAHNVKSYASTFEADVRAALEVAAAHAEAHSAKIVYWGHSLGGLIGAHLATSPSPPRVDAYALCAPTVKVHVSAVERVIVRLCGLLLPWVPLANMTVRGAKGSTNNEAFATEMLAASPSMPFRAAYLSASIRAIDETRARAAHFHKPLLVVTGPPPPASGLKGGADKDVVDLECAYDVHHAGPDELVAAVVAAGKVPATLSELPAPAPHDLVFETATPNPAVDAMVAFVRDVGTGARA